MAIEKHEVSEEKSKNFSNFSEQEQKEILALLEKHKRGISIENSAMDSQTAFAKEFAAEIVKQLKKSEEPAYDPTGAARMEDIDLDDMLPDHEQTTFVAHKTFYVITDAKIAGRNVMAPYGPIEFKFFGARQTQRGKETDLFTFCCYTTKSKREKEFLMKHPLFGTMFFTSINDAVSVDARKASKLAKAMTSLLSYGQHQLIALAKQYNVAVSNDIQEIRAAIASKIADDQMKQEEQSTIVRLKEKVAADELFNKS
jgi:hypothetical protein